ncbi:MAG: ABC transporter permease [Alphaproteobacteria bacterium]|uniref:ABC transporter permease n=1 Tax=PS1 clade bacterium TaxID=2175152 RepID=A0A368DML3_9PROT|nr:ABC transporter permease [Rhodobiaceae bacterium]OUT74388.1 MAG: ABC transporter permease [Rhizobiales bacterium TMED25]RCL73067.1 MAG: ABC transporter permease [PS1 clade bacterium]
MDLYVAIFQGIIIASTPLVLAAIGELIVEKSGVLNLGVEGMMIIGAVASFIVTHETGSHLMGILAAIIASGLIAVIFGILTQYLLSNQVATGLALTLFGLGLASLIGQSYSGISLKAFPILEVTILSDIPIIGGMLFSFDYLVYLSVLIVVATYLFLKKTKAGLILIATGDNHDSAHSLGYSVKKIRLLSIIYGGACAGLGGAYLSLVQTPMWVENMTAGRGWIALAIVVFAVWRPLWIFVGAYIFGGITIIQLHIQAIGVNIIAQYMSMLPYIVTILVLVFISMNKNRLAVNAPNCLNKIFKSDI